MTSTLTRSNARRVLLASVLVAFAAPAHAQTSGGSLTTFVNNIANTLTGTLGQAIAVVAIAIVGLSMAFGGFDMRRGGMSILGIAIIFSAAWIVQQITGTSAGAAGF